MCDLRGGFQQKHVQLLHTAVRIPRMPVYTGRNQTGQFAGGNDTQLSMCAFSNAPLMHFHTLTYSRAPVGEKELGQMQPAG